MCNEIQRCWWCGDNELYQAYHDEEWGVPHANSLALFEKLNLEAFQSGLSWLTILKKRENFRKAFEGFDPQKIARFGAQDIERLMQNAGIVRNRLKIEATLANAKAYLKLSETIDFAHFMWSFIDGKPQIHTHTRMSDIPSETDTSKKIAKELKRRGFRFVGPTTIYAFMQSVGMVNDHIVTCCRHEPCAKLQRTFEVIR